MSEENPDVADSFLHDVAGKAPESGSDDDLLPNTNIRRWVWEHAVRIERILFRFEEAGLTASGKKAVAISPELDIVGQVVSQKGRKMSNEKVNKILCWPPLTTLQLVRSFLGLCSYVRIWIENFSGISKPLRQLTIKDHEWKWTQECENAFQMKVGKDNLLSKLEYGEGAGELIVAVDSSQTAAGAVLLQVRPDGKSQPARDDSITFTEGESRYSQAKLELCGVVKALKKLQLYIRGVPFTLEVDASYLRQMVNSRDPLPNAATNRWVAWLHLFDFTIRHVPGLKHQLLDALSRVERDSDNTTAQSAEGLVSDSAAYRSLPLTLSPSPPEVPDSDTATTWRINLEEHMYAGQWLQPGLVACSSVSTLTQSTLGMVRCRTS